MSKIVHFSRRSHAVVLNFYYSVDWLTECFRLHSKQTDRFLLYTEKYMINISEYDCYFLSYLTLGQPFDMLSCGNECVVEDMIHCNVMNILWYKLLPGVWQRTPRTNTRRNDKKHKKTDAGQKFRPTIAFVSRSISWVRPSSPSRCHHIGDDIMGRIIW